MNLWLKNLKFCLVTVLAVAAILNVSWVQCFSEGHRAYEKSSYQFHRLLHKVDNTQGVGHHHDVHEEDHHHHGCPLTGDRSHHHEDRGDCDYKSIFDSFKSFTNIDHMIPPIDLEWNNPTWSRGELFKNTMVLGVYLSIPPPKRQSQLILSSIRLLI